MAPSARVLTQMAIKSDSVRHGALVIFGYATFFILFFSPVLFSSRVLAPGDGLNYFLPSYYSRTLLWDGSIWGGFPAAADAPRMFWYPPALLLSLVPHSWEIFVVLAYVIAATFTYGYVYSLTHSRLSAAAAGLSYSLCGFMIAHLGHTAIVHTIAWLPLIVWALTELAGNKRRFSTFWFITTALALACAALAGHTQMFVYVTALSATCALVVGFRAGLGRIRYYSVCTLSMLLGLGLAAVQLVPTFELTRLSVRAQLKFEDFVAFSLPLRQLPMLLFPYLYGGSPESMYGTAYFGAWPSSSDAWGATELTGYAGLLALLLGVVGVIAERGRRAVWFWTGAAIFAVFLALGEATPLARLTYQIPLVNQFRAPARHLFTFAFAVSVLAGVGVAAIRHEIASSGLLRRVLIGAAVVVAACLLMVKLFSGKLNELAFQRLGRTVSLGLFTNKAVAVPLLMFLAGSLAIFWWSGRPRSRLRAWIVLAVLVADLSSFAWFYEWRYRSPYRAYLNPPAAAETYRVQLDVAHERMQPIRGVNARLSELPPNLSHLWNIPSASGHGPLILARTSTLMGMKADGSVDESWRNSDNQSLDLMAVRYVLLPASLVEPPAMIDEHGIRWSAQDFAVDVGPACNSRNPQSFNIDLVQPVRASSIALVGALACSVDIPDRHEVLRLTITDDEGKSLTQVLRAGEHFSEWAFDCADVRPTMQHGRAQVFRTYSSERAGARCEAHDYIARLPLDPMQPSSWAGNMVKHIQLQWIGSVAGTFALKKITLFDDHAVITTPVNPIVGSLNDDSRWRYVGDIDARNSGYGPSVRPEDVGTARVYDNLRVRPRVWLATEVLTVSAEEALAAVRTSRLPDGRAFDPAQVALVEVPVPFKQIQGTSRQTNGKVGVKMLTNNVMEVETDTSEPAFLVTSDVFYPGWRATVDGAPTPIFQTNYALRGVSVPAGRHVVRFEFRPTSLFLGAGISALSFLLLAGCAFWFARQNG
jgi:membrane protein YfhO